MQAIWSICHQTFGVMHLPITGKTSALPLSTLYFIVLAPGCRSAVRVWHLEASCRSPGLRAQEGEGTYNVHDGQHILLHISPPVVGHHHLVSYHQCLHIALPADRSLQAQLASLCLIPQGSGRWWLQCPQPPRTTLPWFLIWETKR